MQTHQSSKLLEASPASTPSTHERVSGYHFRGSLGLPCVMFHLTRALGSRVAMRVALVFIGVLVRPLGGLWPFTRSEDNHTCDKAGTCNASEAFGQKEQETRGSASSPGTTAWWFEWTWETGAPFPTKKSPMGEKWYIELLLGFIWRVWEGGMTWCGTLCASIGLAARWTYWLATFTVILGMVQLTYWTYAWVVRPMMVLAAALCQYVLGRGSWRAVLRGNGEAPFEVRWAGPQGQRPWSVQYVQDSVRGRGEQQLPYDLLVSDGVAVARLRHGAIRGRTNRHGFLCQCDTVHSASHRYWRHALERARCAVHLCSADPCTAPEAAEIHVMSSAVSPQSAEVDLSELAGRGPISRTLNATWFMMYRTGANVARSGWTCVRCLIACCSCSRSPDQRRGPRPDGDQDRTPRHDLSETESEIEDNLCQADVLGWKEGTQHKKLCRDGCKEASVSWVKVLPDDCAQSSQGELSWDNGLASCQLCARHQESYELSKARRICSVEGCDRGAQTLRKGVKLCRMHACREEKPPSQKPKTVRPLDASRLNTRCKAMGWATMCLEVWWTRWVIAGLQGRQLGKESRTFLDQHHAKHEPRTPVPSACSTHWLDHNPKEGWIDGSLRLDAAFPCFGLKAPKPCGTLRTREAARALVWDPNKPLPALHNGSWVPGRSDALHLLGHGKQGVGVIRGQGV